MRVSFQLIILFAIVLLAAAPMPLRAEVKLSVQVGWDNSFRVGRWTPIYVTLQETSPTPREVIVEIYAPTDRRYALRAWQAAAISQQPVTLTMFVPLSYRVDDSTIVIKDANSGRRLENYILSNNAAYPGMPNSPGQNPRAVDPSGVFFGVSGIGDGSRILGAQLNQTPIQSGYVSQELLPATPIGYDGLDALVLNQPELFRIQLDQQRAIADWVRAGGTLIVWPGPGPNVTSGPIAEILPCSIGENGYVKFDAAAISRAGLSPRMAKVKGRALSNPVADAKPITVLDSPEPLGYRQWVGYGQVILFSPDLSKLIFDDPQKSVEFWRGLLAGVVPIPIVDNSQPNNNWWNQQSRRAVPLQQTMDWLGDVPGAGQFGFSYIAGTLLALMAIVGPVDWFVLKRLGKQPWTWVTITGWIGVVTCGAIYMGHVFKAGDLYFRTASIVDEAGGTRVASTDVFGLYSPQTRDYNFTTDAESWWRPASDNNPYGGGEGLEREITCHQDYRGNRPEPIQINVWNLRYLEGQEFGQARPMLEARLKEAGEQLTGKITNRSDVALSEIRVRTSHGTATVAKAIEPGGTIEVDAHLNPRDITLATQPVNQQQAWYQRYTAQSVTATTRPAQAILAGVADDRATQIDRMLRDRDDVACVYASYDAPTDRVKVDLESAKTAHAGLVRALVPLD